MSKHSQRGRGAGLAVRAMIAPVLTKPEIESLLDPLMQHAGWTSTAGSTYR